MKRPSRRTRFSLILAVALSPGLSVLAQEVSGQGAAVAIVFDTSGSMRDSVQDAAGKPAPKYVIGVRALKQIVNRLAAAESAGGPVPRKIEASLVVFENGRAQTAVPYGPFRAAAFEQWADAFKQPNGATPLGDSMDRAARDLMRSTLPHKHILVITDGMNTAGPKPEAVLERLQQQARRAETSLAVHFVAFDVSAEVFKPVRDLGATVVGAADEAELNAQLGYIVERKILLEDVE
ncbi:MAG: VWA domain-containing protein [Verrucomicrobiales bacterium]|nr:VWA domain-containing protein [Verrucomicrobiales bacterium]